MTRGVLDTFAADLATQTAETALARAEERLRLIVREELERREQDRLLTQVQLAAYLGKSPKALGMFLARGSGAGLAALAVDLGGRRAWRRSDVDGWLSKQKDGAR